jgi:hypothetical protein
MAFGLLAHRESLSDTALCLKLQKEKLYHLGMINLFISQPFPEPMRLGTGGSSRFLPLGSSNEPKLYMAMTTSWILN